MNKAKNIKGFTLIELTIILAILTTITLLGLKTYNGYIFHQKSKLLATQIFKIKKKLSIEAEQLGTVTWEQFFNKKQGPGTTEITIPSNNMGWGEIIASYTSCGRGLDCLVIEVANVENSLLDYTINNYLNNTTAVCTKNSNSGKIYLTCTFHEN